MRLQWSKLFPAVLAALVIATSLSQTAMAASPSFSSDSTRQNSNLENDNMIAYISGSNVSFQINTTDNDRDLANATFEFDGTNYTDVSSAGLQAWWKFNDPNVTMPRDYTGNGFDGLLNDQPNVTWISNNSGVPPLFGDGLYFRENKRGGGPAFFNTVGTSMNITNNMTLAIWVYYNTTQGDVVNQFVFFLNKRNSNGGSCQFRSASLEVDSTINKSSFVLSTGGNDGTCNGTRLTGSGSLVSGAGWMHLAATYNSTYMTLYMNGTDIGETYKTGDVNFTADSWKIGSLDGSQAFNGSFDDARIYNRSLSHQEIRKLYEAGMGGGALGEVYQIPDGNSSSTFFINISNPGIGNHNFRWYASDFAGNQNSTLGTILQILTAYPWFSLDYIWKNFTLEDNAIIYESGSNISFQVNVTDVENNLANATFEFNGVNYTGVDQTGLIGWWKFNECSGNTTEDVTGNALNDSFEINSTFNSSGRFGCAADFDRSPQSVVNAGNNSVYNFDLNDSYSFTMWVFRRTAADMALSEKWRQNSAQCPSNPDGLTPYPWAIRFGGATSATFNIYNGSGSGNPGTAATGLSSGQWYFIAFVKDNSNNQLLAYTNGVQTDADSIAYMTGTTKNFCNVAIGNRGAPNSQIGNAYDGLIDDFMIWNRTLNATEIAMLYEAGNGGGRANVVYSIPNGTSSSVFFINMSMPNFGYYNAKWYAADALSRQNSTSFIISILGSLIGTNCYNANQTSRLYACSYDSLEFSPAKAFGIIHAGDRALFKSVCSDVAGIGYRLNMTSEGPMRAVLPFISGSCSLIGNNSRTIESQGIPAAPFGSYELKGPTNAQIRLQYEKIKLEGDLRIGPGAHKVCFKKIRQDGPTIVVNVTSC